MANRYQDDRSRRDRYSDYRRQQEQFQSGRDYEDDYGQMGDSWRDQDEQQNAWQRDYDRSYLENDRFGTAGYGAARYSPGRGRRFDTFTGNDFGGRDFAGGAGTYGRERSPIGGERARGRGSYGAGMWGAGTYGAGSQLAANHGEWREPSREYRDYRDTWGGFGGGERHGRGHEHDERGFLERAGDTIAHWLGDDADYRRGYRGRGPANYTRSDERIREDACDRLTEDWRVDASQIEIRVEDGELTLDGTVSSREQKRRAEDCVEDLSGVRHVQNNLRVRDESWGDTRGSQSNPTSTQA